MLVQLVRNIKFVDCSCETAVEIRYLVPLDFVLFDEFVNYAELLFKLLIQVVDLQL